MTACSNLLSEVGEGDSGVEDVPFRYEVTPSDSCKTNCYKPNPLNSNCDHENHKNWTIGAAMLGNLDAIPRQDKNKVVSLVWEAWV